ncbi:MAG: histone deacetylase [Saprospiraceae bacterium]
MRVAFSPIYHYQLPPKHRFPMAKYDLLPEQLLYEGTLTEASFFEPERLTEKELLLTHTQEFWRKLQAQDLSRKEIRDIGFPLSLKLVERGLHIAQGTLSCARYAQSDGVALNIAGGTHHSFADKGEGFCVFNDIAIAANVMLTSGEVSKVVVIDLDVHQGNGNAKLFENEPRVFTLSFHGARNYPTRKMISDLDLGFEDKTEDEFYLSEVARIIPSVLDKQQPDFVFYLSGVDVLAADKLGRLSISPQGCRERDRLVLQACHDRNLPVAVSMGGGYAERLATIIDAHANTFRVAKEVYG